MSGWIRLHRQIRDHWLWSDSNKLKMWLDIILEVNHAPAKMVLGYNLIECQRGQTVRSLQGWADRWNISKDSARHFLMLLQKDNMIVLENMNFTTRLTVCNYDRYNTLAHGDQTEAKRKPNGSQTGPHPNNNNKEGKECKEELFIRQQTFKNEIESIAAIKNYSSTMITSFYAYWSEPNRAKTKMKCEMQKTWDTARRLTTWAGNEKRFKR